MEHKATGFPVTAGYIKPRNLYRLMYPTFASPRNEIFYSTPLTSGGARKIFADDDGGLASIEKIQAIIELNGAFATYIASEIGDYFRQNVVTIPHRLGVRQQWGEFEFNRFWMYYITGVHPDTIEAFEESLTDPQHQINKDLFNDHSLNGRQRLIQYTKFTKYFLSFIQSPQYRDQINPVNQFIFIPGYKKSLGCTMELIIGKKLHIPSVEVIVNMAHARYDQEVKYIASWIRSEKPIVKDFYVTEDGAELIILHDLGFSNPPGKKPNRKIRG
jgi:hypothetical protein